MENNKADQLRSGPAEPTVAPPSQPIARELTFGEKAVGIDFNPGSNYQVLNIKTSYANLINDLNDMRDRAEGQEQKRMYSIAITELQTSQMWAIKAVTWKY